MFARKEQQEMDSVTRQALYEGRAGREESPALPDLVESPHLHAKLWDNPCWFSFRLNYLALHFNGPVYSFIQQQLGLLRPEFVVLWSLYLGGDGILSDVVRSSGFPKNTLSRAAAKLFQMGLIEREIDTLDQRRVLLTLTEAGRDAVEKAKGNMIEHERLMLSCLSPAERLNLSEILTKLVSASSQWPMAIDDDAVDDAP